MAELRVVRASKALSPTGVYGFSHSINPYVGCAHSCAYCYAPFVMRRDPLEFRKIVRAKRGLSSLLRRELRKERPERVLIGSVTDPYQPFESRLALTRSVLQVLVEEGVEFTVMTKGTAFLRDLDLLRHGEVGVSISCYNDQRARRLEPGAPPPSARIRALKRAAEEGVRTYLFFGPVAPGAEDDVGGLIEDISGSGIGYVMVDSFRLKSSMLGRIEVLLSEAGEDPLEWMEEARTRRSFSRVAGALASAGMRILVVAEEL